MKNRIAKALTQSALSLSLASLLLAPFIFLANRADAGDGIDIKVTNDTTNDIVVTVYDETVAPKAMVLDHMRVNGFTSVAILATPDDSGRGNLSWTATSVDRTSPRCGHADDVRITQSSALSVHANAECKRATYLKRRQE